ncbi:MULTISPECIES: helix-turn-helix transcriptional regulator [Sphingobium]|uniref:helix-turn-helix transcriptional regulator n=1 Tax=Sphingobium TaxID=165695 RepID=UPI000E76A10B|nr:helix-turn-helix domain-containing protein [Sphingobium limneticum]
MVADAGDEYLTVENLASYTSLTRDFWNKLRCEGGGPRYVKISARVVRYRRSDVDAWMAERTRLSTFQEAPQ